MPGKAARIGVRIAATLHAVETAALALLVAGMVLLAAAQILLRNLFHTGFPWAERLLGMALLWMTLLGALAATGARRHLAIDAAAHFFPPRVRRPVARAAALFAAVACALLARAAWRYCAFQREMETGSLLGIPDWAYYTVMPAAFGLMACRFLGQAVRPGPDRRETGA